MINKSHLVQENQSVEPREANMSKDLSQKYITLAQNTIQAHQFKPIKFGSPYNNVKTVLSRKPLSFFRLSRYNRLKLLLWVD